MNPFDIADTIRSSKKYAIGDIIDEKDYTPFMVNRALSYKRDALPYAQEMNLYANLDNKLQYDFLFYSIRQNRSKERVKWGKKLKNDDLDAVIEYYGYSYRKAIEVLKILNKEQISYIKEKLYAHEGYQK